MLVRCLGGLDCNPERTCHQQKNSKCDCPKSEQVMKAQNGRMALRLKGKILNQEEKPVTECFGQSKVEALRTPNEETTDRSQVCQDPFETQDLTGGFNHWKGSSDAAGAAIGEEGAMHGSNVGISSVSVSLLEGIYMATSPPPPLCCEWLRVSDD